MQIGKGVARTLEILNHFFIQYKESCVAVVIAVIMDSQLLEVIMRKLSDTSVIGHGNNARAGAADRSCQLIGR